jgi:hypothetical protein
MASYHCTVKAGASASAGAHAAYIEREGKYKSRSGSDLEAVESGNLPDWAERSADFWEASDSHERANAKAYREYEVALPREMTPAQRLQLVREFVRTELGDRHAYTFAIHNPRAALEGGEQPHAHIMFSERVIDGIQRETPEHYFKQSSSKDPARGGCKKVNSARKTSKERKADLVALRERWGNLQNRHLEKHGHADRVDHRTLQERGIERPVPGHLGPKMVAAAGAGRPGPRSQRWMIERRELVEVQQIPELEKRLDAEQRELATMQAEPVNPPAIDAKILADGMAAARARFEAMKQVKAAQAVQDRAAAEKKAEAERQAKPKDRGQGDSR